MSTLTADPAVPPVSGAAPTTAAPTVGTTADTTAQLPAAWPTSLHPGVLDQVDHPTPYLLGDLATVVAKLAAFRAAMPRVAVHYAVKCNPAPEVLAALAARGAGFEIASFGELELLRAVGVDPAEVLYSNPVKPAAHIAAAAAVGVWRFAADSEGELRKIARIAPGAAVHVRMRVDDSGSTFPLSLKFGVDPDEAAALLRTARDLGLRPYGLTFHVGSQSTTPASWTSALVSCAEVMRALDADGIRLEMLDIGGGFPASYGPAVPAIEVLGAVVERGLDAVLPYLPALVVAEPGRHLVAESAVMVTTVLGREVRGGEHWLYVDVSAFHGLMETQQTPGGWDMPLWTSRPDHAGAERLAYTVTGPTCDSGDTMFWGVELPADLEEGDRLYIGSAGAYTLSYASSFNGFPPPPARFVQE